jgi:hypothetical protein
LEIKRGTLQEDIFSVTQTNVPTERSAPARHLANQTCKMWPTHLQPTDDSSGQTPRPHHTRFDLGFGF